MKKVNHVVFDIKKENNQTFQLQNSDDINENSFTPMDYKWYSILQFSSSSFIFEIDRYLGTK